MNLLFFEFKKNVFKLYVLLTVVACTVINLLGIYFSCSYFRLGSDLEAFQQLYNEILKGELTADKINFVISETERLQELTSDQTASHEMGSGTYTDGNVYSDFFLFKFDIYPKMDYAVSYYFNNNQIVEKARNNIPFFESKNNRYEVRRNEKIATLYDNRTIENFYDLRAMAYFVEYDFSSLIVLLVCLLMIIPVFVGERESEMNRLLPSFKNGGMKLVWTKILFTLSIVVLTSLWFSIWDIVGFSWFSPLRGFEAPLYALEPFQFTPLNLNFYQYILLTFVYRTVGIETLALLVLLASQAFRKTLYAFSVGAGVILIPYLSQFTERSMFKFIELINPALLIKNRYLFMTFSMQNFFDHPIPSPWLALAVNLFVICLAILLIVLASKHMRLVKTQK